MFELRRFRKADDGLIVILAIFFVVVIIVVAIMAVLALKMAIDNILPIAIAIILVICIPKAVDIWGYKTVGRDYKGGPK